MTEASSSVAMESEGFRRGLNELLYKEGLDIDLIATDRSPSIRKIMREEFQQIHHEFDPWHVAKGSSSHKTLSIEADTSSIISTRLITFIFSVSFTYSC